MQMCWSGHLKHRERGHKNYETCHLPQITDPSTLQTTSLCQNTCCVTNSVAIMLIENV